MERTDARVNLLVEMLNDILSIPIIKKVKIVVVVLATVKVTIDL